jgi:N-acetylneuraminate synthase/N,N'-diacetyllegionaminate synthase
MTIHQRRQLGGGGCYVIAEVGINHNGDMDVARRLIDMARDAGADAVKFQNYRAEDFLSDRSLTYTYCSQGQTITEPQWDMFKRYELTGERLATLAAYCRESGVDFASTPTNEEGVAECAALGAMFLKNGSDYLTHLPLIEVMARTGLPTILSTGMASFEEISDSTGVFRAAGGGDLYLMHCVSLYPAPLDSMNLRRIPGLAKAFGVPVGFSDHTEGIEAAPLSVALGAVAIERHVTIDRDMPGPDHRFSSDPAEFRALVAAVRAAEGALGDGGLDFVEIEREARMQHRLSCVAAKPIRAGTALTRHDIAFRRPGTGMAPKEAPWLIGRSPVREIPAGHLFQRADFG